jgi:pyridine nucleotide-disulfide oxidoreductase family protein
LHSFPHPAESATGSVSSLLLVGGGHAHLFVLEALAREPWPGVEVTLVSPDSHHHYSGMVPGYLQGTYAEPQLRFDLEALCDLAGVRFRRGRVVAVAPGSGTITLEEGASLPFDMISFDIGSVPAGLDTPGVREHAATVRPMSRAVELRGRLDALIQSAAPGAPVEVAVVGAGSGGFEVALAVEARIRSGGRTPRVRLLEEASEPLAEFEARVRRRGAAILAARGVELRTGARVTGVRADRVEVAEGPPIPSSLTIWLTGAAAPPVFEAGVDADEAGFLRVDRTLRAVGGAPVWGAGDCIALEGHPGMPRAGVYAVRQGPVLARNLRAALDREEPESYTPQASFLSIMNTADGRGLLRWKGFVTHGRIAWWLKDWIDRRFMRRFGVTV